MKTTQEIHDMKKDCAKAIGEVTDGSEDIYKGWIEALNWVTMTNEQPEPEPVTIIEPSLEAYMDGVALNILQRNYHKSTNGIWSKAEVDDHWEKDGDVPEVWEVFIDFGCQDDTRNESYREKMYFFKKDGEWTCDDVSPIDTDWLEDPADRDDRLYHEEQDHIAMEKAKENK